MPPSKRTESTKPFCSSIRAPPLIDSEGTQRFSPSGLVIWRASAASDPAGSGIWSRNRAPTVNKTLTSDRMGA